ncbi:MAG: tetratricopeptide repeat protein [Pirellulaceae bacterium]
MNWLKQIASNYRELGEFQKSLNTLETIASFKDLPQIERDRVERNVAEVHLEMGDIKVAEELLLNALQNHSEVQQPGLPRFVLQHNIARIFGQTGRADEALTMQQELVERSVKESKSHRVSWGLGLATTYIRLQRYSDAETLLLGLRNLFSDEMKKSKDFADYRHQLGTLYLLQKRFRTQETA